MVKDIKYKYYWQIIFFKYKLTINNIKSEDMDLSNNLWIEKSFNRTSQISQKFWELLMMLKRQFEKPTWEYAKIYTDIIDLIDSIINQYSWNISKSLNITELKTIKEILAEKISQIFNWTEKETKDLWKFLAKGLLMYFECKIEEVKKVTASTNKTLMSTLEILANNLERRTIDQ